MLKLLCIILFRISLSLSTLRSNVYTLLGLALASPTIWDQSVFLLACLLDMSKSLYMAESRLSANQHYIKQVEC